MIFCNQVKFGINQIKKAPFLRTELWESAVLRQTGLRHVS